MVDLDSILLVVNREHVGASVSLQVVVQGHIKDNTWRSGIDELCCGRFIVTILARPCECSQQIGVIECLHSVVVVPLIRVAGI